MVQRPYTSYHKRCESASKR